MPSERSVATYAAPGRASDDKPVLEAVNLRKDFVLRHQAERGVAARSRRTLHAFEDISLSLFAGKVTALVGESGSGKSTIARVLAQLYPQTSGTILLDGLPINARRGRAFRRYARSVQMVFQDPFSSLNPTRTVRAHLVRPLKIQRRARTRSEVNRLLERLLGEVNLTPAAQYLEKFPHELSGGQRQRVAVARALASSPSVLLADEPVSMLDVSIRLGVLNLLGGLAAQHRLAILYITHDIASARYFADTILVMYAGRIVEEGPSEKVTQAPAHPYTRLLLESAPDPDRASGFEESTDDSGEPPSLINPPTGCRFHPRCPEAMEVCSQLAPPRIAVGDGQWTRCWLYAQPSEHGAEPDRARARS